MSFFGVTKEKIDRVWDHPNADRLQLASLVDLGFQFVVAKDTYKSGDDVLYFPVDSLIPENIQERLGVVGRLSGKQKNRIKTVRLRGEFSVGIVCSFEIMKDLVNDDDSPETITEALGVTKYEPDEVYTNTGTLRSLPLGLSKYDIEGVDRNRRIVDMLMDVPVVVTEKMEGTQCSVAYDPIQNKVYVNSRNMTIEPIEGVENTYWKVAERFGIIEFVRVASEKNNNVPVVLYFEICGPKIQNNIYGFNEHRPFSFDMMINGEYVHYSDMMRELIFTDYGGSLGYHIAPQISVGKTLREFLDDKTVQEASNGKSAINPIVLREGIVIKPMEEMFVERFGRVILKHRDAEYLEKTGF